MNKIKFFFVLTILIQSINSFSQNDYEINTVLMNTTFMIEGKNGSFGTGFILGVPTKNDKTQSYPVLITAKHVLDSIKGDTAYLHYRKLFNNQLYIETLKLLIRQKGKNIYKSHPRVDVAVMYVDKLPFPTPSLSIEFLVDDKKLQAYEIHPGDELDCLGYPLGFSSNGNKHGYPIPRSGKIASYPLTPSKNLQTFLLDFEIYEGNSGGPVYFVEEGRYYNKIQHIGKTEFIAGLVSQQVILSEDIKSKYEINRKFYPLKVAVIVHASMILETISLLPVKE